MGLKDNLLDLIMSVESEWLYEEISHLYYRSHRFEINLDKTLFTPDNARPNILNRLIEITEDYISQESERINDILEIVSRNKS